MFKKIVKKIHKKVKGVQVPSVFIAYQKNSEINANQVSLESVNSSLDWLTSLKSLSSVQHDFLKALIAAITDFYPIQAYQLLALLTHTLPEQKVDFIDVDLLEGKILSQIKIGVAVITYNRLSRLKDNIDNIKAFSNSELTLVVADDGSTDGTKAWCDENAITCISGENAGVVANKNRALYYLHHIEKCDVSILLEDDCKPNAIGWDKTWALAALVSGHVNFAHKRVIHPSKLLGGDGHIFSPYISKAVTGQCTATSLSAFNKVGYLNPMFKGYGCGHVEWTQRFITQGFDGHVEQLTGFPCINIGLSSEDAPTHKSDEDIQRNQKIKASLSKRYKFVYPWDNKQEQVEFIAGINGSLNILNENLSCINISRQLSDLEINNNFFFIHIPKTAGTSFRKALEEQYGVIGDYGNNPKHTSQCVHQCIYNENDPLGLKNELNQRSNTWLTGHVSLAKYSDMVSARHIITFVRNPIQQVISHYNHYVTLHGFKGSIDDFLKKPMASNFQRKNLNSLPLGLIGYVGLTDYYDESIQLINGYYGLNLDVKNDNVNNKKTIEKEAISIVLQNEITALNLLDIAFVEQAHFLHRQRVALTKENKQWVYSDFSITLNNNLVGCAYYSHTAEAVELEIFCNGDLISSFRAQGFYGAFSKVNFPRERYIGVHLPLSNIAQKGDKLEVFAKQTGQQLTYKPLVVKK